MAHLHFTFLISTMICKPKRHIERRIFTNSFMVGGFLLSPLGFCWAGFVAKCSHQQFCYPLSKGGTTNFHLVQG